MISASNQPAQVATQIEVTLIWVREEPLYPSRNYLLKLGTQTVGASVTKITPRVKINTLKLISKNYLELNAAVISKLIIDI